MDVEAFITRWSSATISERSHYQTFISQLCALIGVTAPDQEKVGDRGYCFERRVEFRFHDGGAHRGFIDCYRRGAFVLEAKQSQKRAPGGDAASPAELIPYFSLSRLDGDDIRLGREMLRALVA